MDKTEAHAFLYDYLFIIVRDYTGAPTSAAFTLFDPLTVEREVTAVSDIPLFTDLAGAEEFRDKEAPGYRILQIYPPKEKALAVLARLKAVANDMVIDLYRLGRLATAIPIDELIRLLHRTEAGPGEAETTTEEL